MWLWPEFSVDFKLHLLKSAIWLHSGRRLHYKHAPNMLLALEQKKDICLNARKFNTKRQRVYDFLTRTPRSFQETNPKAQVNLVGFFPRACLHEKRGLLGDSGTLPTRV